MGFQKSLFTGEMIFLDGVDLDTDPTIEAGWTYDLKYARWYESPHPRPLAEFEIKKFYEKFLKETEETKHVYHFTLRLNDHKKLVGFLRIHRILWMHSVGQIDLAIGDPLAPEGCLKDALELGLRYAFHEINLFRLGTILPEYEEKACEVYRQAGFVEEVRQRDYFYFDGRYWDGLRYGILYPDWNKRREDQI